VVRSNKPVGLRIDGAGRSDRASWSALGSTERRGHPVERAGRSSERQSSAAGGRVSRPVFGSAGQPGRAVGSAHLAPGSGKAGSDRVGEAGRPSGRRSATTNVGPCHLIHDRAPHLCCAQFCRARRRPPGNDTRRCELSDSAVPWVASVVSVASVAHVTSVARLCPRARIAFCRYVGPRRLPPKLVISAPRFLPQRCVVFPPKLVTSGARK
jgi:hypothetical protein